MFRWCVRCRRTFKQSRQFALCSTCVPFTDEEKLRINENARLFNEFRMLLGLGATSSSRIIEQLRAAPYMQRIVLIDKEKANLRMAHARFFRKRTTGDKFMKKRVTKKKAQAPVIKEDKFNVELLDRWQSVARHLELLKVEEIKLRLAWVERTASAEITKGTENIELPDGAVVKVVKKINYSWVRGKEEKLAYDAVDTALEEIEKTSVLGELIAERLVRWKPELSLTEYALLSPEHKKIIDSVILTAPATPTIEVIPPKDTGESAW
jgi:hypothetical protein